MKLSMHIELATLGIRCADSVTRWHKHSPWLLQAWKVHHALQKQNPCKGVHTFGCEWTVNELLENQISPSWWSSFQLSDPVTSTSCLLWRNFVTSMLANSHHQACYANDHVNLLQGARGKAVWRQPSADITSDCTSTVYHQFVSFHLTFVSQFWIDYHESSLEVH